jgi:hypothetical protein
MTDPGPELLVESAARRALLQVSFQAQGVPVLGSKPDLIGRVEQNPGLGMELDAQDMAIALVLYGLDDYAVERGGDDPKALSEFFGLLMVGRKNERMVFPVPADLLLKLSLLGKLDFVERESRELLLWKEMRIGIPMPVGGTQGDSVLDSPGAIYLGPDVLGECSSSSHVEALAT